VYSDSHVTRITSFHSRISSVFPDVTVPFAVAHLKIIRWASEEVCEAGQAWSHSARRVPAAYLIVGLLILLVPNSALSQSTSPTAQQIVNRSAQATYQDWEKAPLFDFCELDRDSRGTNTYQVLMTHGWPHKRLLAVNGDELSSEGRGDGAEKPGDPSEPPGEQHRKIAQYEKERQRDQRLIDEFTGAMNFTLAGTDVMNGRNVFVVEATPRSGYVPRSRETQVLSAARGRLWIDQVSFHFVKVQAEVFRPVMIVGVLARIEPGTRFELEETPVGDSGIWLVSHLSVEARAKILFLFPKSSQADDTYFDFRPSGALPSAACNQQ
jgi:hypothetical protein